MISTRKAKVMAAERGTGNKLYKPECAALVAWPARSEWPGLIHRVAGFWRGDRIYPELALTPKAARFMQDRARTLATKDISFATC
jgi:hypothetical protein